MSSAKDFVAGECGTSNPLMKATQHLTHDQTFRSVHPNQPGHVLTGEGLTNEFLQGPHIQTVPQPNTFQMGNLLSEIDNLPPQHHPSFHNSQFQHHHHHQAGMHHQWANEFSGMHEFHNHNVHNVHPMLPPQHHPAGRWEGEFLQPPLQLATKQDGQWQQEFTAGQFKENGMNELEDVWQENMSTDNNQQLRDAASQVMNSLSKDDKMANTNFASYISGVAGKPLSSTAAAAHINSHSSGDWADQFQQQPSTSTLPNTWSEEFVGRDTANSKGNLEVNWKDQGGSKWAEEFQQDENQASRDVFEEWDQKWRDMAQKNEHPWLEEFEADKTYEFSRDNPFKDMSGAFDEGVKRMKLGDLSNAVLLFEAVVQSDPEHVEAWHHLGQAQAQNEQEDAAIIALNRTLALKPNNLPAVMALAVSQTNESKQIEAVRTLRKWIMMNPKYARLTSALGDIQEEGDKQFTYFNTISTDPFYLAVENAFVEAARVSPQDPDLDVQCALGILFHISGDFEKAVDCFQAAIEVRPDDALLWNKLGATLANGNRSEEAVNAYRRALELNPGFTRSRYNLGISCINLRANKEAVEHFLTALDAQRSARGPTGEIGQMSDSVWNTLRMTLSVMKDNEAYMIAERRDLDALMRRFDVPMMKTSQDKLE